MRMNRSGIIKFRSTLARGVSLVVIVLLWCFCAALLCSSGAKNQRDGQESLTINDGIKVAASTPTFANSTRSLVGGETESQKIRIASNQYLRLVVNQRGIRLRVALLGPKGNFLAEKQSSEAFYGSLRLSYITKQDGIYSIIVSPVDKHAASGSFRLKIDELRSVQPQDRIRVAAEQSASVANHYFEKGNWSASLNEYNEAMRLWNKVNDPLEQAEGFEEIGDVHHVVGDLHKAKECFERAVSLYRSVNATFEETRSLNDIGAEYLSLGELDPAFESLHRALQLSRGGGDLQGEAISLKNIGFAYQTTGESQRALDSLYQALDISRRIADAQTESSVLLSLGSVYSLLNQPRTALDFLEQARMRGHDLRGPVAEQTDFYAIYEMAQIHQSLGQGEQALELLKLALMRSRALGDSRSNARALNDLGRIYEEMGDQKAALAYFREALAIARETDDRRQQANALSSMGANLEALGQPREALRLLTKALPLIRSIADRPTEATILYSLARVSRAQGQLENSLDYIKQTVQLTNSLRYDIGSHQLRSSYSGSIRRYYEFYIDLLMQLDSIHSHYGYDGVALQVSEQSRARGLLESLNEARLKGVDDVDPVLLEREQVLQMQISAKVARQLFLGTKGGDEMGQELRQLNAAYQEIRAQIRTQSPRYAALIEPQPLNARQIQEELPDDNTILLEYSLGDERSYLWAVTPDSINSYELPGRKTIEQAVHKIYRLITTRNTPLAEGSSAFSGELLSVSAERYWTEAPVLSQMLLGPVAELLGKKKLLIVSDGPLQYVPFEALPVPSVIGATSEPEPLILDHEIAHLPSASTLAMLRQTEKDRTQATKAVAVIADPVLSSGDPRVSSSAQRSFVDGGFDRFPRLLTTSWEAENIFELAPENKRFLAVGFAANRDLVMSGRLRDYRILHFATHGISNSESDLSGILLSSIDEAGNQRSGVLLPQDVYNLKLSADLVVLSACETALGPSVKSDGINGLSSSFMYAGAQSVVTSLWKVDDTATADLMTRFYEGMLKDNLQPSAALRRAQIEMWKEKRWRDPYYWAAFTLQGNGDRDVSPKEPIVSLAVSTMSLTSLQNPTMSFLCLVIFSIGIVLAGFTLSRRYRTLTK
jgi:CHAT domain-containing protein/tetratricopeptide (TPR) repeat protein